MVQTHVPAALGGGAVELGAGAAREVPLHAQQRHARAARAVHAPQVVHQHAAPLQHSSLLILIASLD